MISSVQYYIGKDYTEGEFLSENSDYVAEAFRAIVKTNEQLFNFIPYDVIFTNDDPYTSAKEMRLSVATTGKIRIYTEWGGHPFLTKEENNVSRAVHDVFGHLVCGCPFTFQGEYSSYLEQRRYYPQWTWKVLFAEIPAQTCAYYYNQSFDYKQRAIEAPQVWLDMCKGLEKDFSKNAILERWIYCDNSKN
jgi:hypothetical protein